MQGEGDAVLKGRGAKKATKGGVMQETRKGGVMGSIRLVYRKYVIPG